MWPQALQMTRDECRGILRRLELESYSHVISVFRAQGGLSDTKAKLLEELRGIFHISLERHRVEARRVANDEELATIAEAISGPNTWQEWSREGRRSFPMLPRIPPQTALALLANNIAAGTAAENSKLPYPADTATAVAEEHAAYAAAREAASATWDAERGGYVVCTDPFKMPDIPTGPKKNLKRNMSESQTGSNKKRIVNNETATSPYKQQKQYQHITANSVAATSNLSESTPSSNIRKLYHNHSSKLQQQRFFHQQQVHQQQQQLQKQKSSAKKAAAGSRQATPAKSGRRSQKAQDQKQQQQQQILQQQAMLQQQADEMQMQQHTRNLAYVGDMQHIAELHDEFKDMSPTMPQIAASKKDITKNLSKLHIPTAGSQRAVTTHDMQHVAAISPPIGKATSISGEKPLISTPVQKYIVEDRQAPPVLLSSTPQIMTLPQLSAAATKLRAVNTTILPPGTKLTTAKKLPSSTLVTTSSTLDHHGSMVGAAAGISNITTSQPQVFSIIDGTTITTSATTSAQSPPIPPTHTPPAVIQLHSSSVASEVAALPHTPTPSSQGKVLTTKLLPIVLSSSGTGAIAGSSTPSPSSSSANITKIETLNNGATLVAAAGSGGIQHASGNTPTTYIKNLPSSMLLSGASGSNTLISTLGAGASVFRKQPNIIKTGIITGMGASGGAGLLGSGTSKISSTYNPNTSNSGGPQIISNVKLTPAINTTTATSSTLSSAVGATQHQFLQQQLKNVTTTGIRASVKICQSPNGKVFIQPATLDAAGKAKLQGNLQHKLLSNSFISGSATGTAATTPPQRISIQKVQIIPAPMSSPVQQQQQQQKSNALTIGGNKNNMIFMSAANTRTTAGTITFAKSNIIAKSQSNVDIAKPNVVVIGAGKSTMSTLIDSSSSNKGSTAASTHTLESSQMITEDTPVDILNMPIIVDNSSSVVGSSAATNIGNNIGDTVTVLSSNLIETGASHQALGPSQLILGATDWEMELDQATAVAAATKARTQRHSTSGGVGIQRNSTSDSLDKPKPDDTASSTILLDDSFEDVIVEEQEEDEEQQEKLPAFTNDDIIMLDAENGNILELKSTQRRQQHVATEHDDEHIVVIDDEQQQSIRTPADNSSNEQQLNVTTTPTQDTFLQSSEYEADAGFDETIDTEIDENTAIEYIEEDQHHILMQSHDETVRETMLQETISEDDKTASSSCVKHVDIHNTNISDVLNTLNSHSQEFDNELVMTSGDESDDISFDTIDQADETVALMAMAAEAGNSSQDEQ